MPELTITHPLLYRLILASIAIVIAGIVYWIIRKFFHRYKNPTDPALKSKSTAMLVVYSILRFTILVILILALLSIFGVNVSGAIAGLGIAGAAAVFALQDLLKDFIMGITIVSDHFFAVGDIVDYNGYIGKVISLTMRSTKIKSLKDASILSVQNNKISEIKVLSHVVNIQVPLPYDLPVGKANELLEQICRKCCELKDVEDCVSRDVTEFKDSCVTYLVVLYCDPANYLPTRRAVLHTIMAELEAAGIHIPFPQLDIHSK